MYALVGIARKLISLKEDALSRHKASHTPLLWYILRFYIINTTDRGWYRRWEVIHSVPCDMVADGLVCRWNSRGTEVFGAPGKTNVSGRARLPRRSER